MSLLPTIPSDARLLRQYAKEFHEALQDPTRTAEEAEQALKVLGLAYLGFESSAASPILRMVEEYEAPIIWRLCADEYLHWTSKHFNWEAA